MKNSKNSKQNGKGDAPRNCFSESYKENYDRIFRKTGREWAILNNIQLENHYGWTISGLSFENDKISLSQFSRLVKACNELQHNQ